MREVLGRVGLWLGQGKPVAVCRVVEVVGSGVRPAGAAIALDETGEVVGSASGGCVEGALVQAARRALGSGGPPELVTFGCSDDEAFDVGLTCGGLVRVLLERLEPAQAGWVGRLAAHLGAGTGAVLVEVLDGPAALVGHKELVTASQLEGEAGGGLSDVLGPEVARDALADLEAQRSAVHSYRPGPQGGEAGLTVFIDTYPAPPRMLIVGAASFTAALAAQAKLLGYRVTVCDARAVFASRARFPMADDVVVDWPDRYLARAGSSFGPADAICVLTHDPKFDVPALQEALATRAGYLGALGSRRTHEERCRALIAAGVAPTQLARIMGPIGMDIGARTPEETAISICAEIIALRTGRPAPSLRDGQGPIHLDSGPVPVGPVAQSG